MTAITLAYPPSSNRYWRSFRGRVVRSDEASDFKRVVGRACAVARLRPLTGPVSVVLKLYRPRRAGDLDNRIKVLLDALQGFVFENDSQVVELHAYRHEDKNNPRVEVVAESVSETETPRRRKECS